MKVPDGLGSQGLGIGYESWIEQDWRPGTTGVCTIIFLVLA